MNKLYSLPRYCTFFIPDRPFVNTTIIFDANRLTLALVSEEKTDPSFPASSDTVLIILRTSQSSFNLNAVVDLIPQLPEILCAEIILNHAIPVDADEFDIQYESNTYLFQLKNAGFMAAMLAREMQYFSANLVQFSRTIAKISSAR